MAEIVPAKFRFLVQRFRHPSIQNKENETFFRHYGMYFKENTLGVCVLWIIRDKLTTDLENNCFYRAIKKSF